MHAHRVVFLAALLSACGGRSAPPRPPQPPRPYFAWYGSPHSPQDAEYAIAAVNRITECVGIPHGTFKDFPVYVFDRAFVCGEGNPPSCGCSTYKKEIQISIGGERCSYRVGMATEILHQALWFHGEETGYSSPRWKTVAEGGCRWW